MVVQVSGAVESASANATGPYVAGAPSPGRGVSRPVAAALLLLAAAAAGSGGSVVSKEMGGGRAESYQHIDAAAAALATPDQQRLRSQLPQAERALHAAVSSHIGIIWCHGCSLSSETFRWSEELLRLHGLQEWKPPYQEFLKNKFEKYESKSKNGGFHYCQQLRPVEVNFTWSKNAMQRLKEAASVLKGELNCSNVQADAPTVMIMKGSGFKRYAEFAQWATPDTVRISFTRRSNVLDWLICAVKDCFTKAGYPVDGDGRRRSECRSRRKNKSKLSDDVYKAYLNPKTIVGDLALAAHKNTFGNLPKKLHRDFGDIPFLDVEDMFEFEYDPDPAALRRSVAAWALHLEGLGVPPDRGIIESHLMTKIAGGFRQRHSHKTQIYNWQEIREAILGSSHLSWMWRD